jgi:hypothetical protein
MSDRIRPSDLPYAGDRPSGVGLCKSIKGDLMWDSGSSISSASGITSLASAVYNGDGTLASVTINGIAYTFTYSSGKIATVNHGGVTKTYTWSGDQLVSVVVA